MPPTPPEPLDYSSTPPPSSPPRRRPIIDLSLAFSCVTAALAVTVVLFMVVPRAEATFKDYSTKLPTATVLLIAFSKFCQRGGIILVWILFAVLPFLSPLMQTWPPAGSGRRYFRPSRLFLTLFLMFFFGWIIMGLFLPYTALIDALSNTNK
jgi:hypothetical protein